MNAGSFVGGDQRSRRELDELPRGAGRDAGAPAARNTRLLANGAIVEGPILSPIDMAFFRSRLLGARAPWFMVLAACRPAATTDAARTSAATGQVGRGAGLGTAGWCENPKKQRNDRPSEKGAVRRKSRELLGHRWTSVGAGAGTQIRFPTEIQRRASDERTVWARPLPGETTHSPIAESGRLCAARLHVG
jgi:hypothetical protein